MSFIDRKYATNKGFNQHMLQKFTSKPHTKKFRLPHGNLNIHLNYKNSFLLNIIVL